MNKQLDFDEFEKRVKDNYANEHLKVTNKKADNSLNENIIEHINNIYAEEELDKESTCQNFRQVRKEGSFPCIKQ